MEDPAKTSASGEKGREREKGRQKEEITREGWRGGAGRGGEQEDRAEERGGNEKGRR